MEATELRIGNYLLYNSDIKKVSSIHNDNTIRFKDGSSSIGCFIIKNKNIKPIPLTEEILLKCGFEKQMAWTFSVDLIGGIRFVYYLGEKGWSLNNKNYSDFPNLKYLHQLQNLIYAITGEELNVNF